MKLPKPLLVIATAHLGFCLLLFVLSPIDLLMTVNAVFMAISYGVVVAFFPLVVRIVMLPHITPYEALTVGIYFSWFGVAVSRTVVAIQWWPDGPKTVSLSPMLFAYFFLLSSIGGFFHLTAKARINEDGHIVASEFAKLGAVFATVAALAATVYIQ